MVNCFILFFIPNKFTRLLQVHNKQTILLFQNSAFILFSVFCQKRLQCHNYLKHATAFVCLSACLSMLVLLLVCLPVFSYPIVCMLSYPFVCMSTTLYMFVCLPVCNISKYCLLFSCRFKVLFTTCIHTSINCMWYMKQ